MGANCLKYLKRGWNRKEGRGNKDLKRGQAGSRGGCLKRGEAGTPLRILSVFQTNRIKRIFWNILQNSLENIFVGASQLVSSNDTEFPMRKEIKLGLFTSLWNFYKNGYENLLRTFIRNFWKHHKEMWKNFRCKF